ncbi:MAG TPA: glycosyltransferase family 4 protein [Roseiflexaceae bacterium]
MRILHVVEATIAGVRTHVQALATGLDRRRFQSAVVCPPRREHSFGDERFVTYLTSAGIPVLPVPMRRSISPVADVAALSRLFAIIRRERFDIVHLHSSKAGFLGRLAARMAGGAAVIYSPHGLSFLGNHGPATRRLYLTLEQIGGRMCDRIIATSASERATIVARRLAPAGKVAQIDLGIDPDPLPPGFDRTAQRTALGIPDGARLIGTLARASAQKNPLLFVDAAARVLRGAPDAYFIWCGGGELCAAAEARAHEHGIATRCRFLGHREDAQQVLAAFDLFWLTSDYESFGMATAEAMALELPVVATDVVGTCDVVAPGVTGILVPPRDPAALARATIALLGNPAHARALGTAGRARVLERFTRDRMLDATASLYQSLAGPDRSETGRHAASSWLTKV